MSNRKEHNLSVNLVAPGIDENLVDDTNYFMDFPSQIVGPQHRKYFGHDSNPFAFDSILVNRFDARREFVRQWHMMVDKNKQMQQMLLMMSMLNQNNANGDQQQKFKQMLMIMMMMRL